MANQETSKSVEQARFVTSGRSIGSLKNLGPDGLVEAAAQIEDALPTIINSDQAKAQIDYLLDLAITLEENQIGISL